MRVMTIRIERDTHAALASAAEHFARAWDNGAYAGEYLSFESPAALFRVLTPVRWGVLEALQKTGPSSLRGLARSLGRDVKAVHRDVAALIEKGLIEKDASGRLRVPFSRIHAEFDLMGRAA